MDLKEFLKSKFDKKSFVHFISERFYGFEENLNGDFLGKVTLDDKKELGFFVFQVDDNKDIENNRVGLNNELKKKASERLLDSAIAAFYNNKQQAWRLSFIRFSYDEANKQQVSNLKKFTFVLGISAINTAYNQLKDLKYPNTKALESAFGVEKVSNEFFAKYRTLFEKLNENISSQIALFGSEENMHAFSKKLLGRIVFLYFLQKKGWLGVPKNGSWGDGDKSFISELYKKDKNDFYAKKLSPLFFDTLNRQRADDYSDIFECKIPFLNGGLFDKNTSYDDRVFISDEIFGKIFDTFDGYNFTIIEDSAEESEIAIDPEMLGRVFENLLEENYRKGKGAFYTPREIVSYMCRQSIKEKLSQSFEAEWIDRLINKQETDNSYIKKHANEIKQAVLSLKALDPAIGSGAFPMGMLQTMVEILTNIEKTVDRAKLKRSIIENSIYGVDIDPDAVEIAKLRFWLSLTVDEEVPSPLPNLDFKIMQGNSLIETINGFSPIPDDIYEKIEKRPKDLFNLEEQTLLDEKLFDKLTSKIHKFYGDTTGVQKQSDKDEIKSLIKQIINEYLDKQKKMYSDSEKNLADFTSISNSAINKKKLANTMGTLTENILIAERVLAEMLKNNFQTKELFLYKLFFGEVLREGGFDIVIGNPPYLRIQGIDKGTAETYKTLYKSATGSFDLYVLFTEKALQLINDKGMVNFIMPHKWVNSAFGKGLRGVAKDKFSRFISFREYQVFNASTYTSLVWFTKNSSKVRYIGLDRDLSTNTELAEFLNSITEAKYTTTPTAKLGDETWTFSDNRTAKLLAKIEEQPLKVKDVFEKVFTGLQTSKDSVYFLEECQENDSMIEGYSKELDRRIVIEKGLVKPLLKGDDVHRYETLKSDKVVIFPYYKTVEDGKEKAVLFTEAELKKEFPKGYAYLKECEAVLRGRESGRLESDEFWYRYIYPKNLTLFDKEKLVQRDISLGCNFAYDANGDFYQTTTVYGYVKYEHIQESYKFYMAMLNSKLLWWYLQQTGTTLANGFFRFMPRYIEPFPLPKIELEDTKPFEILVDKILAAKQANKNADTSALEREIDQLVYNLYDLTDEEIAIVEGE